MCNIVIVFLCVLFACLFLLFGRVFLMVGCEFFVGWPYVLLLLGRVYCCCLVVCIIVV